MYMSEIKLTEFNKSVNVEIFFSATGITIKRWRIRILEIDVRHKTDHMFKLIPYDELQHPVYKLHQFQITKYHHYLRNRIEGMSQVF